MPAIVQKDSEYQRHFQWNASKKSRSYSPPLEVLKPAAGVRSQIAAKAIEPSITAKKRPQEAKPTSTTKFVEIEDDDYMLLGNNDKFASNVKYRSKSRDRALNIKKMHKPDQDGDVATPDAPRDAAPPPKVIYDTGAPKPKAVKQSAELPKASKSVGVQNGKHVPSKSALKAPPPEPKVRTQEVKPIKSQSEPVLRESRQPQQKIVKQPKVARPEPRPVDRREKRKGQLNEFVQTDLNRGVADSGQEVPTDYAMRYQKGVAPLRSKGPKRLSEYEMQFKWRKGLPSSPMLDAEQLVYKNNPSAPPFSHNAMAKASEYKTQFQAWQLMKSTPNLAQAARKEEGTRRGSSSKRTTKHKRSRSLEDMTPDQRPAAGMQAQVSAEDKRMVKESLNPQRLHFPHGKSKNSQSKSSIPPVHAPFPRAKKEHLKSLLCSYNLVNQRVRSEYASNFAAPQKFEYEMGAWMGADPPHIVNRPDTDSLLSQDGEAPSRAWFSEVVELRRKADEYKRRAQGTHFSREHLAQLYARQAEMWDTASSTGQGGESVVDALSLESARSSRASSVKQKKRGRVGTSLQLDIDSSSSHMGTMTPLSERTLTPELVGSEVNEFESADDVSSFGASARSVDLIPGRIPTPQLRGKVPSKTRHHLDRTTPSVGGAILTSPSREPQPVCGKKPSIGTLLETPDQPVRECFSAPGHLQVTNTKSPAFGKPTQDSHVLVDEETSSDHTLRLDFVKSRPQVDRAKQDLATRLSTIKEASGEYRSTGKSSNSDRGNTAAVTLGNLRQSYPPQTRQSQQREQIGFQGISKVGKPLRMDEPVRKSNQATKTTSRHKDSTTYNNAPARSSSTKHQANQDAFDSINKSDLVELKSLSAPPQPVKIVLEAVCLLMGVKLQKSNDPGNMFLDSWPASLKMLADPSLLMNLKNFDKDNIPAEVMTTIRTQYLINPDFVPERVKRVSAAVVGLCKWVLAIEEYDRMLKGNKVTIGKPVKTKNVAGTTVTNNKNLGDVINRTKGEVQQMTTLVNQLEAVVNEKAGTVENLKKSMAHVMPALESATEALSCVKTGDVTELKSLANPPQAVKTVMEAVCILMGIQPQLIPDRNNPGQMIADYWKPAKQLLGNQAAFLTKLCNFDKDNIPEKVMTKVRTQYCNNPEMTVRKVEEKSMASVSLLKWVLGLEAYDRLAKSIGPKMRSLRHAEKDLEMREAQLKHNRAELKALEQKLRGLQQQYNKVTGQKQPPQKQSPPTPDYHSNHSQDFGQYEISRDDIPQLPVDDDAMSLSAQSIASTCSQASELYERAKHRRDQFW